MLKKTALSVFAILFTALLVATFQIFRYEYFYQGSVRVDKVTGVRQYHCIFDEQWKGSVDVCSAIQPDSKKNSAVQAKNTERPVQCFSHKQYIDTSLATGFICLGKLEDGRPSCGRDDNRNALIEPWELNWDGMAKLCASN